MSKPTSEPTIGGRAFRGRGKEAFDNARRFMTAIRGRPRKGEEAVGTSARSLRLPNNVWTELEALAARHEVTLHKLLRIIVAEALYTDSNAAPRHEGSKSKSGKSAPANDAAPKKPRTRAAG